jgi:hypothetical protein
MLQTEWFTFAAPPKCGNQWFRAVLKSQGIEVRGTQPHHMGSAEGLPSITIQRHAHDWLYSYYRRVTSPIGVPPVDAFHDTLRTVEPKLDTFDYFALRYIDLMPGRITRMFEEDYKSTITIQLDGVGFGMAATFNMLHVPHHADTVQNFPPVDSTAKKVPIPDDLKLAIMEVG